MRLPTAFALALLACSSVVAADVISSESAVALPHWQPGVRGNVSLAAVGATRMYVAVQDGGLIFGMEIKSDGEPDVSTRRLLGAGRLLALQAMGDDFYLAADNPMRVRRLSDGKETPLPPSTFKVVSNGTRLLVVYRPTPSTTGILLDRDLNVVVPEFRIVFAGLASYITPVRGKFLLLSDELRGYLIPDIVTFLSIDDNGSVKSVPWLPTANIASVVSNGSDVVFITSNAAPKPALWAQHYALTTLIPSSDVTQVATDDTITSPAAMATGSDYYVGWLGTGSDAYVRRLGNSESTRFANHAASITDPTPSGQDMIGGPAGALASWSDGAGNALMRRIDTGGEPHPRYYIPPQQTLPSVASDGRTSMVAWSENDVRVGRVGPDGSALDGAGIVISQTPTRPTAVQILFAGNRYIVFWIDNTALFARWVERDGTPSGDVFRVSGNGDIMTAFNAAWTGPAFVLAWWNTYYQPTKLTVMPSARSLFSITGPPFYNGAAVSGGPRPIAVGKRLGYAGITAAFLDSGIWSDVLPIQGDFQSLHVASNGTDYVMTWTQSRFAGNNTWDNEVWAARFGAAINLIGSPTLITTVSSKGGVGGVGIPLFDGKRYRIVYSGSALGEAVLADDAFTCHCFERTETAMDTAAMKQLSAVVGAGGSVIAYARPVTPPGDATHDNVFVRFARETPPPRRHASGR